jgi:hypothetical protein
VKLASLLSKLGCAALFAAPACAEGTPPPVAKPPPTCAIAPPGPETFVDPLPSIPGKWRKEDLAYGGPATLTFGPDGTLAYNNPSTAPATGRWTATPTGLRFEVNCFSQHVCRAAGAALSCHAVNKNGEWTYVLTRQQPWGHAP